MPPEDDAVPATEHCADVANWDAGWSQWEAEVLVLTNEARAMGANCGGEVFGPAAPLTMNPKLRCSARLHAMDMGVQRYFAHDSLDGRSASERMRQAGYAWRAAGENIAQGQGSPQRVVDGWMDSPGHCRNIMNGSFTEIGIGYYDSGSSVERVPGRYWVQNLGRPR